MSSFRVLKASKVAAACDGYLISRQSLIDAKHELLIMEKMNSWWGKLFGLTREGAIKRCKNEGRLTYINRWNKAELHGMMWANKIAILRNTCRKDTMVM